jgi:hypothetical protein
VERENQHSRLRIRFQNLPRGLKTIQAWHPNIQDYNVWLELLGFVNRFAPITGFTADLPIVLRLEQRDQALPNYLMIIGD